MSDIEKKRQFVMDLYPGPGWKQRVKTMPDVQIIAIYLRKPKKIDKPKGRDSAQTTLF